MTPLIQIETTIAVQHLKIELAQSFEQARQAFESILPQFDAGIIALLRNGQVELANQQLERGPELAIFQSRDHGSLLQIAGLARKALQYDVGNPLTASKMTRRHIAAAQYAPIRIVLYENEQGHAVFEYDKPSSLFRQFGDESVTEIALELDAAIGRALQSVADSSWPDHGSGWFLTVAMLCSVACAVDNVPGCVAAPTSLRGPNNVSLP